jgi:ribose transport system ATP-binding protein
MPTTGRAPAPALQVRGVTKRFGATAALAGVDLTVLPGEIHALIGANGAGKSTLLGVIAGDLTPDSGQVVTGGANSVDGVAIVHQELSLLPELSVAENVCPAQAIFGAWGVSRRRAARDAAAEALGMLHAGLHHDLDRPVKDLPLDKRELVEIARGLCSGSRIILLDEPTSPLTEAEVDHLFKTLEALASSGVAVVLVSHRMQEIRRVAHVATVIRDGRTVLDRCPLSEVSDQELAEHMIGRSVERSLESFRARNPDELASGRRLLRLWHVASGRGIDLHAGEIVGVTALTPEDAREVVRYAWGATSVPELRREVFGSRPRVWNPRRAARAGVAYVSGDRKQDALFPELDLVNNVMAPERVVRRRPWLSREAPEASRALGELDVKAPSIFAMPDALSGGNQQKMLFAAWLALEIRLLLLDDPTRGVDVEAKGEIYRKVRAMVSEGGAALWWSSDTEELAQVSDRVVVVRGSTPIASLTGDEITEAAIVTTMNQGNST